MTPRQPPMLLVTRPELTALTALQPHQLTRREALGWLTPVQQNGRTGYPWAQVETLIVRALPRTGPRIARAVVAMDHTYAHRAVAEVIREMRDSGTGMGLVAER